MKKFIITLLCLAIIAGGSYFGYTKFQESKDEKRIVDVVPVSLINQDYFSEDRTTEAYVTSGSIQNVELSTTKLVKQVCVNAGDHVKKGDILLVYDMRVVELENEKNKNQIAVIDQEIKEQEKEIKRLQSLQPKENAPKTDSSSTPKETTTTTKITTTKKTTTTTKKTTTTTTMMIRPVETTTTSTTTTRRTKAEPAAVSVRSELTTTENPDGYELDGSTYFRCSNTALVTADFMQMLIDNGEHVILYVYDDAHKRIQYLWDIDAKNNSKLEAAEWRVNTGVISNHGSYAYNGPGDLKNGVFYVYVEPETDYDDYGDYDDGGVDFGGDDGGDIDLPDNIDLPDDGGSDLPDVTQQQDTDLADDGDTVDLDGSDDKSIEVDLTDDSDIDLIGDDSEVELGDDSSTDSKKDEKIDENYIYTRAELAEMLKEAQIDLKEKQLEYRKAELVYKAGLKQKEDGVVTAQIDGVVTRVDDQTASASGADFDEEDFEDDFGGSEEEIDTEEGDFEDFEDHPYIVVQGQANVSLDINVPELSLSKFPKGTVVTGVNYNTGEEFTAVVTGRKDDPVSYRSYGDDNPNSSTYVVTADVKDCPTLAINDCVSIKMPGEENTKKRNSLNIPMTYVRKDGASYYVMVADSEGLLKKRYIKTGKTYYGTIIEVLGGLTLNDKVCFPYGKDVKEGVKTRETEDFTW